MRGEIMFKACEKYMLNEFIDLFSVYIYCVRKIIMSPIMYTNNQLTRYIVSWDNDIGMY